MFIGKGLSKESFSIDIGMDNSVSTKAISDLGIGEDFSKKTQIKVYCPLV